MGLSRWNFSGCSKRKDNLSSGTLYDRGVKTPGLDFMKVSVSEENGYLQFHFEPDHDDVKHIESLNIGFSGRNVRVNLGISDIVEIHPDLIGLSSILIAHPFIANEIHLPLGISEKFYSACEKVLSRYKISSPVNEELEGIVKPSRGRPGLAFSGGADSTAALAIMPRSTVPIFLNRPIFGKSKYNSEAALESCRILSEVGYEVMVVESDLEYIREPVGFPSDIANCIPAILTSRHLGLDSIAFGTVLESAYGVGHQKYINYPKGAHFRFFGTMLKSVGLEMSLPIAGVSEVGTAIINNNSNMGHLSQSCIRGPPGNHAIIVGNAFVKSCLMLHWIPLLRNQYIQ